MATVLSPGAWTKVTLTRKGAKYSIFVDDALRKTKTAGLVADVNWNYPVYVGYRHGNRNIFNGEIRNARYRNYNPTPTIAPTSAPTPAPTTSAWTMTKQGNATCYPYMSVGGGKVALSACQDLCLASGNCGAIYGSMDDGGDVWCKYCPKIFEHGSTSSAASVVYEYGHNALVLQVDDLDDSNDPDTSNCFPASNGRCNLRSAYKACWERDISHFIDNEACHILLPIDTNVFMAKEYNKHQQFVPKKRIKYYDNETVTNGELHGSCCYSCPYVGDCSAVVLSSSRSPCVSNACSSAYKI